MRFQYIPEHIFKPGMAVLKSMVIGECEGPCQFVRQKDGRTIIRVGWKISPPTDREDLDSVHFLVMDVEIIAGEESRADDVEGNRLERITGKRLNVLYLDKNGDPMPDKHLPEGPLGPWFDRESLSSHSAIGRSFLSAIGSSGLTGAEKHEMASNLSKVASSVGSGWERRFVSLAYAVAGHALGNSVLTGDMDRDVGQDMLHVLECYRKLVDNPEAMQGEHLSQRGLEALVHHMGPALREAAGMAPAKLTTVKSKENNDVR